MNQLEAMHEQIEKIHTQAVDHVNADLLHRYIDTQAAVVESRGRQIDDLTARATILMQDSDAYKKKANEMQLVAGRYQFQFEHAMKCINAIDDFFEYRYKSHTDESMKAFVRQALAKFTEAVKPKGK